MTGIDESGFLSDQIVDWTIKHRKVNAEYFNLCEDINKFCQKMMLSLEVHNEYLPEILVASLLARALSNFQGMILLAERGMINECKTLLRCLLEGAFAAVAIEKDTNFAIELVNNDSFQVRRALRAYLKRKYLCLEDKKLAEEKLDAIEQNIKEQNIKEIKIRKIADKAGLLGLYNTAYRVLSGTIHASVRDLQQYLKINEKEKIIGLLWGPVIDDIDFVLLMGVESILHIVESIFQIFSIEDRKEFELLSNRFKSVYESFIAKEEKREKE